MNDEALRDALRSGDLHRLRTAFDRHYEAMGLVLRPWARDDAEVERMIEATWLEAIAARESVPDRGSARAWLFSFLQNRYEEALREKEAGGPGDDGRDESEDDRFVPDGEPWAGHWNEFPQGWGARADDWLRSPQGQEMLTAFLLAAPPRDRLLLVLRDMDGWSPHEVAALTGLLPGVQREELSRAREALRTAIEMARPRGGAS